MASPVEGPPPSVQTETTVSARIELKLAIFKGTQNTKPKNVDRLVEILRASTNNLIAADKIFNKRFVATGMPMDDNPPYPLQFILKNVFRADGFFKNNGAKRVLTALLDSPYVDFGVLEEESPYNNYVFGRLGQGASPIVAELASEGWNKNSNDWKRIANSLKSRL